MRTVCIIITLNQALYCRLQILLLPKIYQHSRGRDLGRVCWHSVGNWLAVCDTLLVSKLTLAIFSIQGSSSCTAAVLLYSQKTQ